MARKPRRMHVVPLGYLSAFAASNSNRRTPAVWRFGRTAGDVKLVGVRDAEVVNDFYTVQGSDGARDTVIEEKILIEIEGNFCAARTLLEGGQSLGYRRLVDLGWFVATQWLRTPRMFQLLRDEFASQGLTCKPDDPQKLMVVSVERLVYWLWHMDWLIGYNKECEHPFLTSDNPVTTWKDLGHGLESGVGFADPRLIVSCPLSPRMIFNALHSEASLKIVGTEKEGDPPPDGKLQLLTAAVPTDRVKRLNLVTVSNAHQHVYASYCDNRLQRFLARRFFGVPAPVRRFDFRPIGSPIGNTSAHT